MATRRRRSTSGSRTRARKTTTRRSSSVRRRVYSSRAPSRAKRTVRSRNRSSTNVIRLEIVQPNPVSTNPIVEAMAARQKAETAKKARF